MDGRSEVAEVPLCVDLDGTLTPVDTLHEALIAVLRRSPLAIMSLIRALPKGRAEFKRTVSDQLTRQQAGSTDSDGLEIQVPLREDLLAWLGEERAKGRRLVLVTAAEERIANAVARQAKCFDEVIATGGGANLSAGVKRDALVARFSEKGFDYAGNSSDDLAVWPSARRSIVVNASTRVLRRARESADVVQVFARTPGDLKVWLRALRTHQWVKNLLVLVPMLLAHAVRQPMVFAHVLLAFLSFSACASSVYLLNDLVDLPSDRRHPRKRFRPLASGAIPATQGVLVAGIAIVTALGLGLLTNAHFVIVLASYYVATVAYSFALKRQALIDVMLLAGLYTVRIIAGGAAAEVSPSFWLLSFSIFLFLSLGIVKRYTELDLVQEGARVSLHGRGYARRDMPLLMALGVAAGFISVLVLALYINSPEALPLYRHPRTLWLLCPLVLFWISRVWLKCSRGEMHDDPIVFAMKDPSSVIVGIVGGSIVFLAT